MKFKYRRYLLYYLARVLAFIFYIVPLRMGLALAGLAGRITFAVLSKYRNITIENLRAALGSDKTDAEIRSIGKRVFENLAKNGIELVNFPRINAGNIDRFVRIKNIDIIDEALKNGRGAIVLTGHFGNWELLALTIRLKGYKGAVVGRRIYFDKYDKYLNSLRKVHDVDIVYRDQSPRSILKILKGNGIMGMLADQDVDSVEGVFVDFFGRPAYTPLGPAALAMVAGASLIPAFMVREGCFHTLVIEKPVDITDTGNKEKDFVENTQKWSRVVESYIRQYPDHWVWMHRRWKTQKSQQSTADDEAIKTAKIVTGVNTK